MSNLFGLSLDFAVLDDLMQDVRYNDETGEVIDDSAELQELFNDISSELSHKLDNSYYVLKDIDSKTTALAGEIKRLQARKKAFENKAKVLKSLMMGAIEATKSKKFVTDKHNFNVTTTKAVNITNEDLIGREYMRIKREIDKSKIKEVLKDGGTVDGAEFVQNKSLRIK